MTPQERGRLDAVLKRYSAKYVNWLVDHVEADYKQITGDDRMGISVTFFNDRESTSADLRGNLSEVKRAAVARVKKMNSARKSGQQEYEARFTHNEEIFRYYESNEDWSIESV